MTPEGGATAPQSAIVQLPAERLEALRRGYDGANGRRRLRFALGLVCLCVLVVVASRVAEIDPATMWRKFGGFTSYFNRIATLDSGARVWTDPVEWFWGFRKWSLLLGQTLLMGYVGTLWGAAFAFVLCFAASPTTCRNAFVRFAARRFLEFCRTVPVLVFALVFVVAFGLGALPGVLALAVHTAGSLGKLFTEVVENANAKTAEGVRASGGTVLEEIRFGVLPQVLSSFASYTLLRFEINVREATVMGFVGAGGIGEELLIAIRSFYYSDVSAILVLIILTVFVLDVASLLGTLVAAILAFPVGLIAARNVVANPVIHFLVRRMLDVIRSVDVLIWALVWIGVVGLGPFAGVLAIACSDFGGFGKLFSETVETSGHRAPEAVRAAGGGRLHEVRFGLLPEVLPVIAGQVLYFFESNVRSATIIGIVGAGGIGLHLYEAIRTLEWREVSFLVLMILVAVAVMDAVSSRLRAAMRGA